MSHNEHRDPQDAGEDAALRRVWHRASDELPPSELDAAIVAAARKSAQDRGSAAKTASDGKRSRNWFMQWQPLAAAATVAGLAFMLLQVLPRDREVIPPIRMDESAPGPVTARPDATELPATERAAAPPGAADAAVAEQKTSGQLAGSTNLYVPAPSAGAAADQGPAEPSPNSRANVAPPQPARTGEAIAVPKAASVEADRQTTAVPRSAESGASIAAPAPASEKRQRDEVTMSSADWAARIVALYESGDVTGATDELRAFRVAEPDADTYLPPSLRDWARTVK
jgi:hypothetical protein